jgi:hypothetical protein
MMLCLESVKKVSVKIQGTDWPSSNDSCELEHCGRMLILP